jgi:hypothetical protein
MRQRRRMMTVRGRGHQPADGGREGAGGGIAHRDRAGALERARGGGKAAHTGESRSGSGRRVDATC